MHLSANEIKEVVRTEELKKYYPLGTHTVKALDGVNLTVKEGEFVAITGKSGSGKSTLLHMLGALDVPTSGEVYIDGKSLASMTREEQAVFRRRKVGVVFQSYNLIPDLSVYENIVLPIELRRTLGIEEKDRIEIFVDGESIILRKYQPACIFCDNARDIINYKGKNICPECIKAMNAKL